MKTELTQRQSYIFDHFFVGKAGAFLINHLKLKKFCELPDAALDVILTVNNDDWVDPGIARQVESEIYDRYLTETATIEKYDTDDRIIKGIMSLLSEPFPVESGRPIIYAGGRDCYNSFYYQLSDTLCYNCRYEESRKKLEDNGFTNFLPGSHYDYVVGIMFELKEDLEKIKDFLFEMWKEK